MAAAMSERNRSIEEALRLVALQRSENEERFSGPARDYLT